MEFIVCSIIIHAKYISEKDDGLVSSDSDKYLNMAKRWEF